jgi:hypothetical protein
MRTVFRVLCVVGCMAAGSHSRAALTINLTPDAGLSGNAAALAAFERAAQQWEGLLADNVTVNINAGFAALGSNTIGTASSVLLQASYNTIRNQMVADNAAEGARTDAIVASLPTAAQLSLSLPAGVTYNGQIYASKANLKAMGFTGLDTSFGASDATITFSSQFAFDLDNSDGVTPGTMDFETVALHEIGHALGFFSVVDNIVGGATSVPLYALDLFRFSTASLPASSANFTSFARDLRPGTNASFSDGSNSWRFATGTSGDGNQASHWKANEITGLLIGSMDPTLALGEVLEPSFADLRALDLIGWDALPIPEPGTGLALFGAAAATVSRRRRR